MLVLLIILLILLLVIVWLMVTPIELVIDSERDLYRLRMAGVFSGWVESAGEWPVIRIKTFFYTRTIEPFEPRPKKEPVKKEEDREGKKKKKKKRKRRGAINFPFRLIPAMVKDFFRAVKVRVFIVDFDTGDDVLNARLYPVCYALSGANRSIMVNFDDYQRIWLEIRTRMINFLWRGIKYVWLIFVAPKLRKISF